MNQTPSPAPWASIVILGDRKVHLPQHQIDDFKHQLFQRGLNPDMWMDHLINADRIRQGAGGYLQVDPTKDATNQATLAWNAAHAALIYLHGVLVSGMKIEPISEEQFNDLPRKSPEPKPITDAEVLGRWQERRASSDAKAAPGVVSEGRVGIDLPTLLKRAGMTDEDLLPKYVIKTVLMSAGFTIKEGQDDLKAYVYDAAKKLLALQDAHTKGRLKQKGEVAANSVQLIAQDWGPTVQLNGEIYVKASNVKTVGEQIGWVATDLDGHAGYGATQLQARADLNRQGITPLEDTYLRIYLSPEAPPVSMLQQEECNMLEAVEDALICNGLEPIGKEEAAVLTLARLMKAEREMFLDPSISEEAKNLFESGHKQGLQIGIHLVDEQVAAIRKVPIGELKDEHLSPEGLTPVHGYAVKHLVNVRHDLIREMADTVHRYSKEYDEKRSVRQFVKNSSTTKENEMLNKGVGIGLDLAITEVQTVIRAVANGPTQSGTELASFIAGLTEAEKAILKAIKALAEGARPMPRKMPEVVFMPDARSVNEAMKAGILYAVKLIEEAPSYPGGDISDVLEDLKKVARTIHEALAAVTDTLVPLPMELAPRDGTIVRLLVDFEDHPLQDDNAIPMWTIGQNGFDNDGEDQWYFAGWNWDQECFTEGLGKVIGWLPWALTNNGTKGPESTVWVVFKTAPTKVSIVGEKAPTEIFPDISELDRAHGDVKIGEIKFHPAPGDDSKEA